MSDVHIRKIPDYIKPYFNEMSQFQHYYEYEKNVRDRRNIEDRFICLKGFSSTTPVINSAAFGRECLGGGFYFRYKGHGIAVDPGIGFISLMHRNHIFISDIDTVIVTHSHLDHNCDVRGLSALNYDYNKNRKKQQKFFGSFFDCNMVEDHKIVWYMDEETVESTEDILKDDSVHKLSECCDNKWMELSKDIKLCSIRTQHVKGGDHAYSNKTYAIKLSFASGLEQCEWGYTSDTRFFEELGQFFQNIQVLLFNISDIYPSDIEGRKPKNQHLGFDGSLKLLGKAMPQIAVSSEFCCTNGDYRYEITKALREASRVKVLLSDPGLMMDIKGGFIKCSLCGKDVPVDSIWIARPEKEFGNAQYICPNCLF